MINLKWLKSTQNVTYCVIFMGEWLNSSPHGRQMCRTYSYLHNCMMWDYLTNNKLYSTYMKLALLEVYHSAFWKYEICL